MSQERRQDPRVSQPLEGSWWGSSGSTRCRIGDVSRSGCFVQSLMNPSPGELTKITISVGQGTLTLDGTIVYAEPGMGFAVKFVNVSDEDGAALAELVAALTPAGNGPAQ